ncbi:MAG: hypothetical protein AB7F22_07715 [Reyranella sp.]|uniref:hypothetical protein n=1 Tax=Reyranella sp. TaxID=1929291 RepID=UPI003D09CE37
MAERHRVEITPKLLDAIVRAETPRDWKIIRSPHTSGATRTPLRRITIPAYKHGYRALWVFFHEVCHALRLDAGEFLLHVGHEAWGTTSLEETIAEKYAMFMLQRYGFPITLAEFNHAKANIRVSVRRERKAGIAIPAEVAEFLSLPYIDA